MKGAAVFAGIAAAALLLFLAFPGVDLALSGLFYDPQRGFFLAEWPPLRFVAATIPWLTGLIFAVAALAAGWLCLLGRPLWRLDRRALVLVVAAIALGPGLLVNAILKDHWGRARPYQVEAFGGPRVFTRAPLPAAQCESNCSFVSGHAALGFSLVGFAFLLPHGRRRTIAIAAALGFGALVGLARIAAGRHFPSDVVFAGLVVFATSWLLYRWLVVRDVLGGAPALRLYGAIGDGARRGGGLAARLYREPHGRIGLWAAAIAVVEGVSIGWVDRPLAGFVHAEGAGLQPVFATVGRLGIGYPYLVLCGLAYAALRWGGAAPRLRPWAQPMRRAAAVPAFFLAAIAVSGLTVDLLKIIFGRTRPQLLFAAGTYDFTWLGMRADHWSFPSGHAATAAALMTALWCLWPRHLLFYVALAVLVAASRVITGAHYLSDIVMGGVIGIVATRCLAQVFARGRLPLAPGRSRRGDAAMPPV